MSINVKTASVRAGAFAALAIALCATPQSTLANDIKLVRIGGTGIALAAMNELGASLTAAEPNIRVEVLPSMGTAGGIKALLEGVIDISLIGHPLKADEKAGGIAESACLTTALVFASSHDAATGLTRAQLPALYSNASPKWPDGSPMRVIMRARSGSENPYLIAMMSEMAAAFESAYKRPGMPVGSTDQNNAKLALQIPGSLAVMTLLQIRSERLDLKVLPLDGIAATPDTIADKTYPFPIRVCLALRNDPTPPVMRFVAHLLSPAGKKIVQSLGAMLSE